MEIVTYCFLKNSKIRKFKFLNRYFLSKLFNKNTFKYLNGNMENKENEDAGTYHRKMEREAGAC